VPGPWDNSSVPRGAAYDRRFQDLEAAGMDMHGEAALVASYRPTSVLDAGCGTGRVAIELSRRGHDVVGVDFDGAMLDSARAKAPHLTWVQGDLADPDLDFGRTFDLVVMAGNVLIFVEPGTEGQVMDNAFRWLRPGGYLVTGYSLSPRQDPGPGQGQGPKGFGPPRHDALAAAAGLVLQDRWSTWDKRPFSPEDRYAVAVHRREI
jgi:SAM-dependent methyltransferase